MLYRESTALPHTTRDIDVSENPQYTRAATRTPVSQTDYLVIRFISVKSCAPHQCADLRTLICRASQPQICSVLAMAKYRRDNRRLRLYTGDRQVLSHVTASTQMVRSSKNVS